MKQKCRVALLQRHLVDAHSWQRHACERMNKHIQAVDTSIAHISKLTTQVVKSVNTIVWWTQEKEMAADRLIKEAQFLLAEQPHSPAKTNAEAHGEPSSEVTLLQQILFYSGGPRRRMHYQMWGSQLRFWISLSKPTPSAQDSCCTSVLSRYGPLPSFTFQNEDLHLTIAQRPHDSKITTLHAGSDPMLTWPFPNNHVNSRANRTSAYRPAMCEPRRHARPLLKTVSAS